MNLYGDYGNITILCYYLKQMGIRIDVDRKELQDNINLLQYDFIYMGSGSESKQIYALNDLMKYQQYLQMYVESDKVALFTGNAMELLGKSIDDKQGLGLIDFTVQNSEKRYTGDVILHNSQIGETVGFINKSSIISGGEDVKLFDYVFKDSNLEDNTYEGYRYRNLFGTHVIGPVLVKNPAFLKEIIKLLTKDKYKEFECPLEQEAYQNTLQELKKRNS